MPAAVERRHRALSSGPTFVPAPPPRLPQMGGMYPGEGDGHVVISTVDFRRFAGFIKRSHGHHRTRANRRRADAIGGLPDLTEPHSIRRR
jgi:hypothetical protein